MEVFTDRGEEGNSKIPGCYMKAGNFGLGNQQASATQRMGLCQVLMLEHMEAEITLSACPHEPLSQKGGFPQKYHQWLSNTERES